MPEETNTAFYRVPLSTAEAEATLATLRAVADLLTSLENEENPLASPLNALRLTPALLRSAAERITDEVPDFLPARADKEAALLAACLTTNSASSAMDSKRQQLERALAAQIPVEIEYYVPSRGETTCRTVDVRGVYDESGGAYLSGYCHLRQEQRLFKLENVRVVRLVSRDSGTVAGEQWADPFATD